MHKHTEIATFAGGCFWCMERPYDEIDGVISTVVGYTGGETVNPTYIQVSAGDTGHAEAISIEYDSKKVSYKTLVNVFWKNIDPVDANGQFCDRGNQYRSEIFYHSDKQKQIAETSKAELSNKYNIVIATKITAAKEFYMAEEYHQNYYQKNPLRYKFYRYSCGRDKRLKQLWK